MDPHSCAVGLSESMDLIMGDEGNSALDSTHLPKEVGKSEEYQPEEVAPPSLSKDQQIFTQRLKT